LRFAPAAIMPPTVIGTIRNEDLAQNLDKLHDYVSSVTATQKEFR
jgi:hypothetical protein